MWRLKCNGGCRATSGSRTFPSNRRSKFIIKRAEYEQGCFYYDDQTRQVIERRMLHGLADKMVAKTQVHVA